MGSVRTVGHCLTLLVYAKQPKEKIQVMEGPWETDPATNRLSTGWVSALSELLNTRIIPVNVGRGRNYCYSCDVIYRHCARNNYAADDHKANRVASDLIETGSD
jgi:hypothetical protein